MSKLRNLITIFVLVSVLIFIPSSIGIITHAGDITVDSSVTYINISGFNETYYTINESGTKIGVNLSAVQKRVNYTCAAGSSIRVIAVDGTVTCETDDAGAGSYDLNISGDTGTGAITDAETLTFEGSADISTVVNANTLTIDYNGTISGSDTNASTACAGTTTYLDGEGNCDDISPVYVQAATWTTIDNYPASCPANQYVQALGDTLTCINVVNDTDTDTHLNQSSVWNYMNVSNFFSIDCDNLDGQNGSVYLDNTDAQTLSFDAGTNVTITNGNSVDISAIDTDTNTHLNQSSVWNYMNVTNFFSFDADKLDGQEGSYYLDNSDTNASTACSGSTTYLDGEGNCDDISSVYVQASDWTTIDNYPASCPANQYVQSIGDTLTCINVVNDTDTFNTTEEMQDASGAMFVGTETRISVTYQDGTNDVDFVVDDMNDDQPDTDAEVPDDITIDSSGKTHKVDDNDKLMFGTGDDACIYYNGTHLIIDGSC